MKDETKQSSVPVAVLHVLRPISADRDHITTLAGCTRWAPTAARTPSRHDEAGNVIETDKNAGEFKEL
jgi:hypothetical protein